MAYQILIVKASYARGTDFARAAQELEEMVNAEISMGWKPAGGLCVGQTAITKEPYLMQAMTNDRRR